MWGDINVADSYGTGPRIGELKRGGRGEREGERRERRGRERGERERGRKRGREEREWGK